MFLKSPKFISEELVLSSCAAYTLTGIIYKKQANSQTLNLNNAYMWVKQEMSQLLVPIYICKYIFISLSKYRALFISDTKSFEGAKCMVMTS